MTVTMSLTWQWFLVVLLTALCAGFGWVVGSWLAGKLAR